MAQQFYDFVRNTNIYCVSYARLTCGEALSVSQSSRALPAVHFTFR